MTNFYSLLSTNRLFSLIKKAHLPLSIRPIALTVALSLTLLTTASYASNEENTLKNIASVSQGGYKKDINSERVSAIIKQNHEALFSDQFTGKASGKIRTLMDNNNKLPLKMNTNGALPSTKSVNFDHDFGIFSALTFLEDDFDGDGYYQTFSVVFDADVYSYTSNYDSEVYAQLYLSKDGINWQHYYTTDNFIIHADSNEDEYEVITTLLDGYSAGHYDVLIDLYEVGYEDIVATYSSDDSETLYGLSLESSDFDTPYVEEVHIYHSDGGSFSLFSVFSIFIISIVRFIKRRH